VLLIALLAHRICDIARHLGHANRRLGGVRRSEWNERAGKRQRDAEVSHREPRKIEESVSSEKRATHRRALAVHWNVA
jgi:hypothetical protein